MYGERQDYARASVPPQANLLHSVTKLPRALSKPPIGLLQSHSVQYK